MLFGGFSLLSGAAVAITTGGDGDVLDKSAEIIADGAYDVGRNTWIQNNSAWKAQPPADWNINVDYEAGQVTGGGMSPFTPVPPPPTPHRPFP
jgi:hypothetical protein